jgi:glycosyltransferase involved in cell wall biosynthesis
MKKPKVSVIVPCYNEEKFIAKCLDSLISQDFPKEEMEILIIDGNSEDKTREIVKGYIEKYPFIKIFENKERYTPFALNIGIKNAQGEIIVRTDAHADYDKNYISKCVENLEKYNADNVGGIQKVVLKKDNLISKSIAVCLSSFFGTGNSHYRTGSEEAKEVDTVFGGCYRKEIFKRIGFFNEKLLRSQDMELNMRLKKSGGKIMLIPDIVVRYYPKSDLVSFWKHNFLDGVWAIYPLKFMKEPLKIRHLISFFFVLSLISTLSLSFLNPLFFKIFLTIISLYLIVNLYFSFKISLKERNLLYLFTLPLVFFIRHFGYGLGSLWGLAKLIKD